MQQIVPEFRQTFATMIGRDTSHTELSRHIAVLDVLLAWAAAPRRRLVPRVSGTKADAVFFDHADARIALFVVRVSRSAGATLEICPTTGRTLSADDLATVLVTLNGCSRGAALVQGDRLRIGFGALKNVAAREAVCGLMAELLSHDMFGTRSSRPVAAGPDTAITFKLGGGSAPKGRARRANLAGHPSV